MAAGDDGSSDREQQLGEIVASYLRARQHGDHCNEVEFIGKYPEFARELAEFLAESAHLDRLAAPLRKALNAAPTVVDDHDLAPIDFVESSGEPLQRQLGDFLLGPELGRGGMGIVYEAEQLSLGRRVAIKILTQVAAFDPRHLQRFKKEAQAAAQLHHTNIVPVFAVGCERSVHYYAMQYIDGQSVAELIRDLKNKGRPSVESIGHFRTVAEFGAQAGDALAAAHEEGIIHRDIKPANLLVDSRQKLWVTDFGLARVQGEAGLTMTGDFLGTLRYMSPEQALARRALVDHRTDIYSLGATLYELLALEPVFAAEDGEQLLEQVTSREARAPRSLNKAIPVDLETIILKSLEKDPSERYLTASDFADDCRRFLEDKTILAARPTLWQRAQKWMRRNQTTVRTSSALFFVAFLSMVAATILIWIEKSAKEAALAQVQVNFAESQEEHLQSRRLSSTLALDRGLTLCDSSEIAMGMLWLARSLELAPEDDANLTWNIRVNLAAWQKRLLSLRAMLEHQGPISSVAASADGKLILTGSEDRTARLWSSNAGEPLSDPLVHPGGLSKVAFSSDGARFFTVAKDTAGTRGGGAFRIWDTQTTTLKGLPREDWGKLLTFAIDSDRQRIAGINRDYTTQIRQITDDVYSRPVLIPTHHMDGIAFHPDGKTLFTWKWSTPRINRWDVNTGSPGQPIILAPQFGVIAIAPSPDGKTLLIGASNFTAILVDSTTGVLRIPPLVHLETLTNVAYARDGMTVFTGSLDGAARLWDVRTGKQIGQTLRQDGLFRCLTFISGSRILATAGQENAVRLWNRPIENHIVLQLDHPLPCNRLAISTDCEYVVTAGGDDRIRILNVASGSVVISKASHGDNITSLALSPDNSAILTGSLDKTARLWNAKTGLLQCAPLLHDKEVRLASFNAEGNLAATASEKNVFLWKVPSGESYTSPMQHPDNVSALSFSPDGQELATGCADGVLRFWDPVTGLPRPSALVHGARIEAVAYSLDGTLVLTTGVDKKIRRWHRETGELVGQPFQHLASHDAVVLRNDGRTILVVSGDASARLWDVKLSRRLGPALQHWGPSQGAAFANHIGQLATLGEDKNQVLLWQLDDPAQGTVSEVVRRVQVLTGLELDREGIVTNLGVKAWKNLAQELVKNLP